MKIHSHYYPDQWSYFERVYASRSHLEVHIVDFIKKELLTMANKCLDKIEQMINDEIKQFRQTSGIRKDSAVEVLKHKEGTVRGANGGKTFYAVSITFPNQFPAFTISEPMP